MQSRFSVVAILSCLAAAAAVCRVQAESGISVGLQNVNLSRAAGVAWSPVYLNNFSSTEITSCSLQISLPDDGKFLLGIRNDTAVARPGEGALRIDPAYSPDTNRLRLSVDFGSRPLGYGTWVVAWFPISISTYFPGPISGEPVTVPGVLQLSGIRVVTRAGSLDIRDYPVRSITVFIGQYYLQDLTGNVGETPDTVIDQGDAYYLLSLIAPVDFILNGAFLSRGLTDPWKADVDESGTITSFDAALILRHAAGLIPQLPVAAAPLPQVPELRVSDAEAVAPDIYRYRVTGRNVAGAISAQCLIVLDTSVVQNVEEVRSPVRGAVLASHWRSSDGWFKVVWMTPEPVSGLDAELVTLVVRQRPGAQGSGVTLDSVFIDNVTATVATSGVRAPRPAVFGGGLPIRNPGLSGAPVMFSDALGRLTPARLPVPGESAPGVFLLKVGQEGEGRSSISARVR